MLTERRWQPTLLLLGLSVSLFACSPQSAGSDTSTADTKPAVLPPSYEGFLEVADCSVVLGWAYNASDPNAVVDVDIYSGNVKLGTARADAFRPDLVSAGKGNGQHAFRFVTPSSVKDKQSHPIQGKIAGLDVILSSDSPKSVGPCTAE